MIIGSGVSGVTTAIRLARLATQPCRIILLEREPSNIYCGIGYHADGVSWNHVFNLPAGRMSVFRENTDDFLNWLNYTADKSTWPEEWENKVFYEEDPAPRRAFQQYLRDRLFETMAVSQQKILVEQLFGEAIDITEGETTVSVTVKNFVNDFGVIHTTVKTVCADRVVLATGPELKEQTFRSSVYSHDSFVSNQYSKLGIEKMMSANEDVAVVIMGSLLAAYDAVVSLIKDKQHSGPIYMVSPKGVTHTPYPEDYIHKVIPIDRPKFADGAYNDKASLVQQVKDEWTETINKLVANGTHENVASELILKGWEPYIRELTHKIPTKLLQELIKEFGSLVASLRVGVVKHVSDVINEHCEQVKLFKGRVIDLEAICDSQLKVIIEKEDGVQEILAGLVISNFSREKYLNLAKNELWRNLIAKGTAQPQRQTGIGLEIDSFGRLVTEDGISSNKIFVVGMLREGDEIYRHGRTGPFAFNVAIIRNQSVQVAAYLLASFRCDINSLAGPKHAVNALSSYRLSKHLKQMNWVAMDISQIELEKVIDDCSVLQTKLASVDTIEEREHLLQQLHSHLDRLPITHMFQTKVENIIIAFCLSTIITQLTNPNGRYSTTPQG